MAATRFEDLPPSVVERAKRHLLDTLGVILAGARQSAAARLTAFLDDAGGAGPRTV